MRFGEFGFRFRLWPTLLLAVAVPLFLALGFWQLERAEQKREQANTASERSALPPLRIDSLVADVAPLRYRRVQVEGVLEPQRQIFIENRREGGRSGFHVITPLRIAGSDVRVLVNGGWVPDVGPGLLPSVEVPSGTIEVTGEVSTPSPPALVLERENRGATAWGKRWPYLTVELFAAGAPYPVQPFVILQSPADPTGFQRHWPKEPPKEGMHIGYALQWFAFALIASVLYLRLSLGSAKDGTT